MLEYYKSPGRTMAGNGSLIEKPLSVLKSTVEPVPNIISIMPQAVQCCLAPLSNCSSDPGFFLCSQAVIGIKWKACNESKHGNGVNFSKPLMSNGVVLSHLLLLFFSGTLMGSFLMCLSLAFIEVINNLPAVFLSEKALVPDSSPWGSERTLPINSSFNDVFRNQASSSIPSRSDLELF